MGAILQNKKHRPKRRSSGKKSFSRASHLVSGYTQKTRSGIRIRVRGHLKKSFRVKSAKK